jgi:hypothetical protein
MTIRIETSAYSQFNATILHENAFLSGTVTASSQDADGAAANAYTGDTTFDFWTPTAVPATLTLDAGSAIYVDAIGIAAHDLGTKNATVTLASSTDGTNYTTRLTVSPNDNETIFGIFGIVRARYWRVTITADSAPNIGVIKIGRRIIFPDTVLTGHIAINHAREVELLHNQSIRGQFLGTLVIAQGAETQIEFGMVDRDFVETNLAEFETHYNNGKAFFFAGSPRGMPKNVGYCKRSERARTMRPSYQEGGLLMDVTLDVRAYVDQ